jgi:hypothetical protein
MRNYVMLSLQKVTGQLPGPVDAFYWYAGTDDDDVISIQSRSTQFQIDNLGLTNVNAEQPYDAYFELDQLIIARWMAIQIALWNGTSSPPAFDDEMKLGPTFFFEHVTTESPRKTWSHGK